MSATIQGAPPAGMRAVVRVPLSFGDGYTVAADVYTFTGLVDGREHLALGLGDHRGVSVPLVRPHSECLTGDSVNSTIAVDYSDRASTEALHRLVHRLLWWVQALRTATQRVPFPA